MRMDVVETVVVLVCVWEGCARVVVRANVCVVSCECVVVRVSV